MAICKACRREMTKAASCADYVTVTFPDGAEMPPVRHVDPDGLKCHDCGVSPGGIHHPGCDTEKCPNCGHQLISCGCLDPNDAEVP